MLIITDKIEDNDIVLACYRLVSRKYSVLFIAFVPVAGLVCETYFPFLRLLSSIITDYMTMLKLLFSQLSM